MSGTQRTAWLSQLLDMGFTKYRCEYAVWTHSSFESALADILENPHRPIPANFFGPISLDDDEDELAQPVQVPLLHLPKAVSPAPVERPKRRSEGVAPAPKKPRSACVPPSGLPASASSITDPVLEEHFRQGRTSGSSQSSHSRVSLPRWLPNQINVGAVSSTDLPPRSSAGKQSLDDVLLQRNRVERRLRNMAHLPKVPHAVPRPAHRTCSRGDRMDTMAWPEWRAGSPFDSTSFAFAENRCASKHDVVNVGPLEFPAHGQAEWTPVANSEYTLRNFSEEELCERMAHYPQWNYTCGAHAHMGTDMHIASEEGAQFRWVQPSNSPGEDHRCDMLMNMKSAVRCIVKDCRFLPQAAQCFYRRVRIPKTERFHPYASISDPMVDAPMTFVAPNNHKDPESAQPPGFTRYPLRPEQLRSLGWMQSREQNSSTFKISYEKLFHGWIGEGRLCDRGVLFSDVLDIKRYDRKTCANPWGQRVQWEKYTALDQLYSRKKLLSKTSDGYMRGVGEAWRSEFGVDAKVECEYPSRGGILADQLGYGKTATALGLIAFDTPGVADSALTACMTAEEKNSYFAAHSTLVLVPPNLLFQWVEQIGKFYLPPEVSDADEREWRKCARRAGTARGEFGCPKSVVCFENISKLKQMTPPQLMKFDIVLCTLRIFASTLYERRRAELAGPSGHQLVKATQRRHAALFQAPFPVLEQFFWRRIIYDESHEIELMTAKVQRALTQMRAQFCWGLTGSPVLNTLRGLDTAAMIMRVDLFGWDPKHRGWMKNVRFRERANSFVQEFVRKNTETSYGPIPMEERVVRVVLQPEERALYLAEQNAAKAEPSQLIRLCSHFSGGESQKADAMTEIERVLEKKRIDVHDRTNAMQGLLSLCSWLCMSVGTSINAHNSWLTIATNAVSKIQAENAKQTINLLIDGARKQLHLEKAVFLNAPEATVFPFLERSTEASGFKWRQCQTVSKAQQGLLLSHFIKRISGAVEGYRKALSSLSFFETTVCVLRNDVSMRTCPVCLEENLELGRIVVSSCGHVYCVDCMDSIKVAQTCGVCRHSPLRTQDFSILKPAEVAGSVVRDKSQFEEFGSKIYAVYQKLMEIRREDPTAKVIMFTQYAWLRYLYENVLRKFGIPFVSLKGNTIQRGSSIDTFQNDPDSSAWILLMDLTNSASGTHLTAANHVLFIHPMVCDSANTAAAYEKQAIGRCRRYGQTKLVKVWRFVASNTIEEEITKLHQKTIAQLPASSSVPIGA